MTKSVINGQPTILAEMEGKIANNIENLKNIHISKLERENQCESGTQDGKRVDENKNYLGVKETELQSFYHGKNVFITGATGFLGKVLVEKLLRSCPGVDNLYLLVRQKKGKDIYTRIEEVFDDPIFDRLKEEVPKFRHKIVLISGDCESIGLGLTLSDRNQLAEKINIIFHVAATVKFDEHLKAALVTNVRAPLYLLQLAREMKSLDTYMHVSTAYSNSHLPLIEERFYNCDTDYEKLEQLVEKLSDEHLDIILPKILGPWPNTYTFTKALAEKEIRLHANNLPVGIFRPAIVTSTAKEPLKCWIDNMYGPTGVVVGCASGVLRAMVCDTKTSANLVPVDLVVNCLIAAASKVHKSYRETNSRPTEPPIYNYVSSVENRITWKEFTDYNIERVWDYPLSSAIWYVTLTLTTSETINKLLIFFLHLVPAFFLDGLSLCIGRKPKLLKMYKKIHKFSSVLAYFCMNDIKFCNKRTRELWDSTSPEDQELFPFSISNLKWDLYFVNYLRGIRKHLFKEDEKNLKQARRKMRRLYYIHNTVKVLFIVLTFYAIWTIFSKILNLLF